jgi:hypothetical protein
VHRRVGDRYSDVDLTFAVADDAPVGEVLADWSRVVADELGGRRRTRTLARTGPSCCAPLRVPVAALLQEGGDLADLRMLVEADTLS